MKNTIAIIEEAIKQSYDQLTQLNMRHDQAITELNIATERVESKKAYIKELEAELALIKSRKVHHS